MASKIPLDIQFVHEIIGDPKSGIKPKFNFKNAELLFKQLEFETQANILADGKNPVLKTFHTMFQAYGVEKFGNKKKAMEAKEKFLKRLQIIFKVRAVEEKRKGANVRFEGPSAAVANAQVRKQPKTSKKKIKPNDPCPCGSGKKYKKCCGNTKGKGKKPIVVGKPQPVSYKSGDVIPVSNYFTSQEHFSHTLAAISTGFDFEMYFLFSFLSYTQQQDFIRHINQSLSKNRRDNRLQSIRTNLIKIRDSIQFPPVEWLRCQNMSQQNYDEAFHNIHYRSRDKGVKTIIGITSLIKMICILIITEEYEQAVSYSGNLVEQLAVPGAGFDFELILASIFLEYSLYLKGDKDGRKITNTHLKMTRDLLGEEHSFYGILNLMKDKFQEDIASSGAGSGKSKKSGSDDIGSDTDDVGLEKAIKLSLKTDERADEITYLSGLINEMKKINSDTGLREIQTNLQNLFMSLSTILDEFKENESSANEKWKTITMLGFNSAIMKLQKNFNASYRAFEKEMNEKDRNIKNKNKTLGKLRRYLGTIKGKIFSDSPQGEEMEKSNNILIQSTNKKIISVSSKLDIETRQLEILEKRLEFILNLRDKSLLIQDLYKTIDDFVAGVKQSQKAAKELLAGEVSTVPSTKQKKMPKKTKEDKEKLRAARKAQREQKLEEQEEARRLKQSEESRIKSIAKKEKEAKAAMEAKKAAEALEAERERLKKQKAIAESEKIKKLAYSDPSVYSMHDFEKKREYMNAVLDILRKGEGITEDAEDQERNFEVELFENNKVKMTEIIHSISERFPQYLFVVVGGAAVKAHHLQTKKEGSKGTGHKTTDFDVKVYPRKKSISKDKSRKWVAEARFKIYKQIQVLLHVNKSMSKGKEFDVLKGKRGREVCDDVGEKTWEEAEKRGEEYTLCGDPTVPMKVSLKTEKKFVPLLEFSFSSSETLSQDIDYINMIMPGTSFSMNYLTLSKLKEILHQNITARGGFMVRIEAGEPNVYRKKILSWLKQLNSLHAVERRSPSPQGGEAKVSSVDGADGADNKAKPLIKPEDNPFYGLNKVQAQNLRKHKIVNKD